jgi:hypothetical protein
MRAKEDDVELREVRVPDAEGWWCRRCGGKLKWFRVEMVSDVGEPPFTPSVYVSDLEEMVDVSRFCTPLTRWYGPVLIPKDD